MLGDLVEKRGNFRSIRGTGSFTFSGKMIWAPVRLKSVIRPLTVWLKKYKLTGRSTVILGALLMVVFLFL